MDQIRNRDKIRPFITKDGSEIIEIFHPNNSSIKSMSFAEATVYTKESSKYHIHTKADEIYFIFDGRGTMEIGGKKATVGKGDCIFIPAKTKHRIKNIGKVPLRILCSSSPPYSHKDTTLVGKKGLKKILRP